MSAWDEMNLPEGEKARLIAESDQMIQHSQVAVDEAVAESIKVRQTEGDAPATLMAAGLMKLMVEEGVASGLTMNELIYNLCLIIIVAVYRLVDAQLPPEEMPPV